MYGSLEVFLQRLVSLRVRVVGIDVGVALHLVFRNEVREGFGVLHEFIVRF